MSTLLDIWSDPINTGLFTSLNNYNVPWGSEHIEDSLNYAYYYNHSGNKIISPFVNMVLGSDAELSVDQKSTIAKTVYSICHKNWQYEWDAMFATYNPIENYDSTETETIKKTGTDTTSHSGSDIHTLSGTDTTSHSGSDIHTLSGTDSTSNTGTVSTLNQGDDTTINGGNVKDENSIENGTTETKNQIYGYNSTDPANDSLNTVTVNQVVNNTQTIDTTSKLTHNTELTQTNNITDTTTYGKSDSESIDFSDNTTYGRSDKENIDLSDSINYNNANTRDLRIHGNIGVTTSQQMIESELELRKKNFYTLVFRDIDEYLTIGIYE